jgi:hypothetical protein
LSACPEAAIHRVDDGDGRTWTLIGHAFQSEPNKPRPVGQIAALGSDAVVAVTYTWAGRWVLIGPEVMVPDAGGLLGVFYLDPAAGDEFLASSSLAVIKQLMPDLSEDPRRLHRSVFSWFITPSSKLGGVKKLLPDQALSLRTRAVAYLKRTFPARYQAMTTDERAEVLLVNLGRVLGNLGERGAPISLALTAGIDSRSTLAAAVAAGVRVQVVTMHHPRITKADRVIPPAICSHLGLKYSYLLPRMLDRRRSALYEAHTLGNSADADAYIFAHCAFDQLGDTAWLVRSGPWSLAKAAWYEWFGDVTWDELRRHPEAFIIKKRSFSSLARSAESLLEWVAWRDAHPEPYDWRDLWHRDQGEAGIASSIEQSLDLLDCASVVAVNCSAFFDMMLSESEAARRDKTLQTRLLELSGTGLGSVPINPALDSPLATYVRKGTTNAGNLALETRDVLASIFAARR